LTDINEKVEYAPWQKVTVPTGKADKEFIVYEAAIKQIPTRNVYFIADESEHRITETHPDHEGTEHQVTWCIACVGGMSYGNKGTNCEHTWALREFLKKRQYFEYHGVKYEEYYGHWSGYVYTSGYDKFFNITKEKIRAAGSGYQANPADDSTASFPDYQNHV